MIEPENQLIFTKKDRNKYVAKFTLTNPTASKIILKVLELLKDFDFSQVKTTCADGYNVKPNIVIINSKNTEEINITLLQANDVK